MPPVAGGENDMRLASGGQADLLRAGRGARAGTVLLLACSRAGALSMLQRAGSKRCGAGRWERDG